MVSTSTAVQKNHGPVFLFAASLLLGGCATLPSNGPTGPEVRKAARASDNVLGFSIIPVDVLLVQRLAGAPREEAGALLSLSASAPIDALGPGDVVNIDIFEVGTTLFQRNGTLIGGDPSGLSQVAAADGQPISGLVIDREGAVTIPYAGRIVIAGRTLAEAQKLIEARLRGLSQSPQVIMTLRQNVTNTVYIMGTVAKPGRMALTLGHETLLEAIANAGGAGLSPQDMIVRFTRKGISVEVQLQDIRAGSPEDLVLIPGDKIELIHQPRSFSVFGAANKIAQVPFDTRTVSLAEALARAGGPSDAAADPRAIFVFRFEAVSLAPAGKFIDASSNGRTPVIYQLNMMKPASYFLAQQFPIHDKDVIYISNSLANRPTKFVQIINQLFSPFFAIRAATQ